MKGDDYWNGRHFWTHFWFGLVLGGGWGACISWDSLHSLWARLAAAGAIGLGCALCAGLGGDAFWYLFLDLW